MNDSPQQLETGSDDRVLPVPTTMTPAIPSPLVAPVNPPVTIPTETADQSLTSQPRETGTRDAREIPQDSDRSTTPVITSPTPPSSGTPKKYPLRDRDKHRRFK